MLDSENAGTKWVVYNHELLIARGEMREVVNFESLHPHP